MTDSVFAKSELTNSVFTDSVFTDSEYTNVVFSDSVFTVAERGWRHVWMIKQRDAPHRFISSILASDRRQLSVRRTSGSQ